MLRCQVWDARNVVIVDIRGNSTKVLAVPMHTFNKAGKTKRWEFEWNKSEYIYPDKRIGNRFNVSGEWVGTGSGAKAGIFRWYGSSKSIDTILGTVMAGQEEGVNESAVSVGQGGGGTVQMVGAVLDRTPLLTVHSILCGVSAQPAGVVSCSCIRIPLCHVPLRRPQRSAPEANFLRLGRLRLADLAKSHHRHRQALSHSLWRSNTTTAMKEGQLWRRLQWRGPLITPALLGSLRSRAHFSTAASHSGGTRPLWACSPIRTSGAAILNSILMVGPLTMFMHWHDAACIRAVNFSADNAGLCSAHHCK